MTPQHSVSAAAPESAPSPDKAAEPAFGTVAVFELPKSLVLPFAPGASSASKPPAPEASRSPLKGAAVAEPRAAVASPNRPVIGETLPLDAPIPKPMLPFSDSPSSPAPTRQPAASPQAPSAPMRQRDASPQAPPPLSLLDHAALCAEIALRPAKVAEVLARFRIDEATKASLDAYFNELRAKEPSADAAWNRTYRESYTGLILSAWKPQGSK